MFKHAQKWLKDYFCNSKYNERLEKMPIFVQEWEEKIQISNHYFDKVENFNKFERFFFQRIKYPESGFLQNEPYRRMKG